MASRRRKTTNNKDKRILGTYKTTFAATKREIGSRLTKRESTQRRTQLYGTRNPFPAFTATKRETRRYYSPIQNATKRETRRYYSPIQNANLPSAEHTATVQNINLYYYCCDFPFRSVTRTLLLLRLSVTLRYDVPFRSWLSVTLRYDVPFRPWRCKEIEIQSKIPILPKTD